jgi:alkylresorcinol/alkylpyrone synthase
MKIVSAASALPRFYYDQATVKARLKRIWAEHDDVVRRLDVLYERCGVEGRHFALPIDRYEELANFGEFNDEWIRCALELGGEAVTKALARAGLAPRDVDLILFSTVTGLAAPSIDARLCNQLGFRPDVKRIPIFGLGCVAGAAALARAADFVRGAPKSVALVLTIELCSLTWQRGDVGIAHVISAGLFGDGATCAVVVGRDHPARGLRVVDTRSVFYRDTEDVMGWRIDQHGFNIVLSPAVPTVAKERLGPDCAAFLADHGLAPADIAFWVCHPGGPKVLAAARDSLGLSDAAVELSWESLRNAGNLSSASVLLILERTLERRPPRPGDKGVLLAMGPGFCSELLLLEA